MLRDENNRDVEGNMSLKFILLTIAGIEKKIMPNNM